jgi:hypothetical protein
MSKESTMPGDREYLAAFCAALPQLETELHRRDREKQFTRAVRSVRSGTPVLDVLPSLGIAPHVLTGPGTSRETPAGSVVVGIPHEASGEVYRCPDGACDRAVPREPGGPIPAERCWLRDRPLTVGEA